DAGGSELWKSDGTNAGTVRVKDIVSGAGGSSPDRLANLGGGLLFAADDGVSGRGVWRSDGASAGTVRAEDIAPGPDSAFSSLTGFDAISEVAVSAGAYYFPAYEPSTGLELWKSDGTAAGTMLVKDLVPGPDPSWPRFLIDLNGILVFA